MSDEQKSTEIPDEVLKALDAVGTPKPLDNGYWSPKDTTDYTLRRNLGLDELVKELKSNKPYF